MAITVVTIDFWNTLFDSSGSHQRNEARRSVLSEAVAVAGAPCETDVLERAYASIWGYFDEHWLRHHRTPTSDEMVREICSRAGVVLSDAAIDHVADHFSRGVLDHPPALLPGAREALAQLAEHSRLALISDTAFSPGSVLRELMEREGIGHFFTAFVFSDETGRAKPHPEAFHRALSSLNGTAASAVHIGDIERTDILGARGVGMRAILYKGDSDPHKYAQQHTEATAVMHHWSELGDVIERIGGF